MKLHYKTSILTLFIFALGLRLSLYWFNPPDNTFDDHFSPIFFIMLNSAIPAKDVCWECNQPPVFYGISALLGNLVIRVGASNVELSKVLQFIPFLFGILTLPIIYLILNRFPLSNFSRIIAFGTVCFLPRHIYMSAMHTNDTISYFFVAICVYVLLIAIDKQFSPVWLISLSILATITIFTKYTGLLVIPMIISVLGLAFIFRHPVNRKKIIVLSFTVLLIPISFIGVHMYSNFTIYGSTLPTNLEISNIKLKQIPGGGINYFDFKPWKVIKTPILSSDNVRSFWTLIYGRMWFDMEPNFLYYTDPDKAWWLRYFDYIYGRSYDFPDPHPLSPSTLFIGSSLIAMGVIPLGLTLLGFVHFLFVRRALWVGEEREGAMKVLMLSVLFLFNAAGIIFHAIKFPFISHMKALFFLNSLPAFVTFLGAGIMVVEKNRIGRWSIAIFFMFLFSLVTIHILDIVKSLADYSVF